MNITEITPTATTENKQHICDLLTDTLKATRDQHDLVRIRYEEIGPDHQQVVLDYEGGGHRSVNVSLDSGIAMVRDILWAIQ